MALPVTAGRCGFLSLWSMIPKIPHPLGTCGRNPTSPLGKENWPQCADLYLFCLTAFSSWVKRTFQVFFSDAFCLLLLLFSYSNYCALTSVTVDTREDCLDVSIPMLYHAVIPSKSSERLGGIPPACCKTDWLGTKDSSLPLKVIQNVSWSTWLLHTAKLYNWSCQIFELSLLCIDVQSNWVLLLGTVSLKLC